MCTDSTLRGDSYQREIEGAVGEGGHEGGEWEWHSVGNGMLRGGFMIAKVFCSEQYDYSFQGVNHVVHKQL